VVKIRLNFGAKVDPVFVPAIKNNSLGFGFHQKNSPVGAIPCGCPLQHYLSEYL